MLDNALRQAIGRVPKRVVIESLCAGLSFNLRRRGSDRIGTVGWQYRDWAGIVYQNLSRAASMSFRTLRNSSARSRSTARSMARRATSLKRDRSRRRQFRLPLHSKTLEWVHPRNERSLPTTRGCSRMGWSLCWNPAGHIYTSASLV